MAKLDKFVFNKVELQDNIYFAKIKDIKLKVWDDENKSLNWSFELIQPPYIGKKVLVWGSTSNIPTPKNRLTQFGAALGYTRDQMVDDSFDTDNLVGSCVKVFLETTLKEDGSPKQHVTKLLPLNDLDIQQLQVWAQQANLTGQLKVAVQPEPANQVPANTFTASPVHPSMPVVNNSPAAPVHAAPVHAAPVHAAPVPSVVPTSPVVAPRRVNNFPF